MPFYHVEYGVEAGAKCGMFTPDEKTIEYMEGRCVRPYTIYEPDADASMSRCWNST
jgi:3-isopropylmalate/(R)-2-methylmalate dehydratase large subunit